MPQAQDRRVYRISGADHVGFLQNLVTNNVTAKDTGLVYTALLTPQGKYLADFFLVPDGDGRLLDVSTTLADDLIRRLTMYRLRSDVTIEETEMHVYRGLGIAPDDGFADPRHELMGWRAYRDTPQDASDIDWDAARVEACVPETGVELIPNETYPLEAGFERLSGVDFRKGCYVGQEVTARMKHKTELRKGFATVAVIGVAPVGTQIERDGKSVGTLFTQAGGKGIAYLRFDRAGADMKAGTAEVSF